MLSEENLLLDSLLLQKYKELKLVWGTAVVSTLPVLLQVSQYLVPTEKPSSGNCVITEEPWFTG